MQGSADLLDEDPIGAIALAVILAAVGYAVITYVMNGRVNLLETVIFAIVFTLVYVAFTRYFDV